MFLPTWLTKFMLGMKVGLIYALLAHAWTWYTFFSHILLYFCWSYQEPWEIFFFFLEWCFQWPLQLIKTTKNQRNLMVGKVMVRIRKKYKLYKNVWWRKEVLPIHRPSMIVKNTWDSFNLVRKKDTKCQERCFTCKLHFQEL